MTSAPATLSLHVLDAVHGRPASGLGLTVTGADAVLASTTTDADGRAPIGEIPEGTITVRFETGPWFDAQSRSTFYPYIEIAARVLAGEHHHVALLLSPFAYSTYRGS